jgi:hypothetical protein
VGPELDWIGFQKRHSPDVTLHIYTNNVPYGIRMLMTCLHSKRRVSSSSNRIAQTILRLAAGFTTNDSELVS